MHRMIFYPAFTVEQVVQVQVFNIITKGKIVGIRTLTTKGASSIAYNVQYGTSLDDIITTSQEVLRVAQTLPLGEIK